MLYHAARVSQRALLTRASSPEPVNVWPSSAFATAIQDAAARAWTRTATRSLRTVSTSASVTLEEEENVSQRRGPLLGVPTDIDSKVRQIPAARSSPSVWVNDDPLVDSGESSCKAARPPTRPTTPTQSAINFTLPKSWVPTADHQSSSPTVHNSPVTTEVHFRTPFQKSRRCLPYSRDLSGLPDSTSPLDLLNNLDEWRKRPPKHTIIPPSESLSLLTNGSPMLNFETLHAYHSRFPAFQTHESFRVLAEMAINEAKFGSVGSLWVEMGRKGMLSDWDSLDDGGVSLWAIWVRWMVRQGKWLEAWKMAQRWRIKMAKLSASRFASGGLPHAIWIEFWGKAHKRVDRPSSSGSGPQGRSGEPPNTPTAVENGELGLEGQYRLLMRQPPHRNHSQITNVRPRTIYAVVRARLRLGDREWSLSIIRDWFERMRSEKAITDTKGNRACLRLLHLYLALAFPLPNGRRIDGSGNPKGFALVREMEAVMNGLTKLNPRVKPNSTTVLLLLRHLRRTSKCADNGVRLVTRYKRLYGDGVDDERVRLRLASFAIKQNNPQGFRKALASSSTPTGLGWSGVALARRRARLMRERCWWV